MLLQTIAGWFTQNQSKTTNGYVKLPGGLILQWGTGNTGGSSAISVTFPVAFPNACLNGHATVNLSGNPNAFMSVSTPTASAMTVQSSTTTGGQMNIPFFWFAIGH